MISFSAESVTVSNVTTVNATVAWTIPFFNQFEEYYITYGIENINLDQTTESVPSPLNTSLVNQSYTIILQDLSPGTIYYLRVAAVFNVLYVRYSDIISFRTYDEGIGIIMRNMAII